MTKNKYLFAEMQKMNQSDTKDRSIILGDSKIGNYNILRKPLI